MATHKQFHFSTKLNETIIRGGLYKSSPHCIAQKFSKETFSSVLEKISKKVSPSPIYAVSNDWIGSLSTSISQELSKSFNAPPENFVETSRSISNIISAIGNGTWSSGFTPVNAIKDLEANLPLYISDYFDQLAGWSREHVFDQSKNKIGSNINELQNKNPYPAESPFGLESALSDTFVKISWKFPVFDIHRPFNTDSNDPIFGLKGEPSSGEVYRPDNNWNESALYIVQDTDTFNFSIGYTRNNTTFEYPDILKELTLVTIPLVAWRNPSGQFLNVDASHKTLGFSNGEQHDNVIVPKSEQLFLFVPHPDFANKAVVIDHDGQFLEFNPLSINKPSVYDFKSPSKFPFVLFEYEQNIWPWSANYLASHLQQHLITAPAPPPGEGTRVRVWKSDPSVKKVGIRELYFTTTSINTGPVDSLLQTVSTTQPIAPDSNGDFLLDFDDVPSQIPETDNHVRFDVVHTFSVVRYVYDLLSGDLQYLDGRPPVLKRPWGENKRLSIYPHAGEQANAFYNRSDASLRFFYIKRQDGTPVYLCRSLDIVSHETGHSFLDILQPNWLTGTGQSGAFHEAFGDLCSLFTLISMADIADLFITLTKANLRDPDNFISAVGEEFGDAIYNNRGKGLRNLTDPIKGSQANPEVHSLSVVFSGFYYDVLVDVFALERNPSIKSDTETLMDVGTNLRRALIIAIRVSSAVPTRTKFQEVATNLETSIGTLGRRLGVDLTNWQQIVRTKAKERELSIAGFGKK
ncbi:hypothetical protein C1645_735766 [Glomus cerebriforme]|uniref:Uncharacterized protein n=1 Tax=Glomus cerebriforme TaxID=658196 RepID=A0A397T4B3_9GLOM|nr:hypothetical protein C1645_735766 [Glomus cerebriforme]